MARTDHAGWLARMAPRRDPLLETAYYAEYRSAGPGANPSQRDPHSHQLATADAQTFRVENFLGGQDGWNPERESR